MATPKEIFAAGRLLARMKAPYFRSVLLSFAAIEAPGLNTIGVTERLELLVDYNFIGQLSPEEVAGLLVHETMHVLNQHGKRVRLAGRDRTLANIANDLAINPAIEDMGLKLPGGAHAGVYPERAPYTKELGFKRGLTADEYYDLLLNMPKQAQQKQQGQGKGSSEGQEGERGQGNPDKSNDEQGEGGSGGDADHDHEGEGECDKDQESADGSEGESGEGHIGPDKPKTGGGWCGSCAGRPMPNEPKEGKDKDGNPSGARTEQEVERLMRQTAEAIREHAQRNRGSVPGGWTRWAEEQLTPPKVPWRTKLARLTRNACAWRDGAVDHRYDAPSRRQAGIGFGAGRPVMPRLRFPQARVLVAIDTSGSMGTQELTRAASETKGVLVAIGADVTFCAVDAGVHVMKPMRTWKDIELKGGGGTDFRPAFKCWEELKGVKRPEVVIFVTDGMAAYPDHPPKGMRVIFVLVGTYRQRPPWGEVIEVVEDGQQPKDIAA